MPLYKRPPIIEAVIEITLGSSLTDDAFQKLKSRLTERYPGLPEQLVNVDLVQLNETSAELRQQIQAHKLPKADASGNLLLSLNKITTSVLAPYPGWDVFFEEAQANWSEWKRVAGWRQVTRIGVRFVNRIDIPLTESNSLKLTDYLNVCPTMPSLEGVEPMINFAVNAQAPLGKDNALLILNVAPIPSPLVKTASFVVDLDIGIVKDLPQNDEGLWEQIARLRTTKNAVFESCITDQTRGLFS